MLPMAKRLAVSLDKANFDYTEDEVLADYQSMQDITEEDALAEAEKSSIKDQAAKGIQDLKSGIGSVFAKGKKKKADTAGAPEEDVFAKIEKLAKLQEMGAITQEEFEAKKTELLAKI